MLKNLRMSTICSVFIAFSLSGFAKEGFFSNLKNGPEVVKKNWDSVFFVLHNGPKSYGMGTAFLVRVENLDKETKLYFLTNNHVLKEQCSNPIRFSCMK